MPKPHLYKTEAIVLKGSNLGEADRLLTLYTPHLGKLRAVARGARKPQSKLGGHVETLTHSLMMLATGHSLDVIAQSQTIHSFPSLRQDLGFLSLALYAADLVDSFTEEHLENPPIFQLLLDTLDWLNLAFSDSHPRQAPRPDFGTKAQEAVLRHFELHLLEELGYRPQLQRCIRCHGDLEPVTNFFSPSAGGVVCPHCREHETWCRPLSVNALKCLRWFQANSRERACHVKLSAGLSVELKGHLQGYVRYILERDIKSATWLERLQRANSLG